MAVRFVSAGAGSGKTYRLTRLLHEALTTGRARPGGVIATTFTRKAATELRERVRGDLLQQGEFALATAMGQARIGTVNSVCGALVERFTFEAGLAPEQQVLDENQTAALIGEAIDAVSAGDVLRELVALARRLGIESWEADLQAVMSTARANDVVAADLATSGPRNARDLLAHFPQPTTRDLDQQLVQAIDAALPVLEQAGSTKKNTGVYLALIRDTRRRVRDGSAAWADWVRLAKAEPEKGLLDAAQAVTDAAGQFATHRRLHEDITQYLTRLFSFAALALEAYAQRKRELAALDFVDQERLFLGLLDQPAVVQALSEELDLLLVDEFQDTSPIQLELFVRLAQIARETVWVGDIKQAIYGFRGSDAELMRAVIAALPALGGSKEILAESRRSRPPLVRLVNAAFVPAFAPQLTAAEVALQPVREEAVDDVPFQTWSLGGKNIDLRFAALAAGIRTWMAEGYQIVDRATGAIRPAHFGDIAILARSNDSVQNIAAALRAARVPWATQQAGLLATPEAVLAVACLRRLNDPRDTLATAEIVSLADSLEPEHWLTDRLRYLAAGGQGSQWLEAGDERHPLIQRLAELRDQLPLLSPSAALELVITQGELAGRVLRWSPDELVGRVRLANLQAVLGMAAAYEDYCQARSQPATVAGLILWLQAQAKEDLDLLAEPPVAAVKVMTHHAAKGLEWPIVILLDLEKDIKDRLWSVQARSEATLDVAAPLRGRWVRYWPWPFGAQKKVDLADSIAAEPAGVEARRVAVEEAKRLLYVSMTRARDCLILAFPAKSPSGEWLDALGAPWLTPEVPGAALHLPGGGAVPCQHRALEPPGEALAPAGVTEPLRWFMTAPGRVPRLPAVQLASAAAPVPCAVAEQVVIGTRIPIAAGTDAAALGNAVHACLAAAFSVPGVVLDEERTGRLLTAFGVESSLPASAVVRQVRALDAWLTARWPDCPRLAEVPIEALLPNGQIVYGRIDLLIDAPQGWILIDHKASPVAQSQWPKLATDYGGQLATYSAALTLATGRPVVEAWLLLPVAGGAVRVATPDEGRPAWLT